MVLVLISELFLSSSEHFGHTAVVGSGEHDDDETWLEVSWMVIGSAVVGPSRFPPSAGVGGGMQVLRDILGRAMKRIESLLATIKANRKNCFYFSFISNTLTCENR